MDTPLSASEQVYRHVKELILSGELPAGEMVTEGQVVAIMSLSRTPVREAFLRLATEGWLRLYPKRGALVVPVQPEEKEQVLEARHLIETHAMKALAGHPAAAAAIGSQLREVTNRMRQAVEDDDLEAFALLDTEFHVSLVVSAGNTVLSDIYRGLRDRLRRMTTRSVWHDRARMLSIIDDHSDLAEIIAQRDVDAFSSRLMQHMRATHESGFTRAT